MSKKLLSILLIISAVFAFTFANSAVAKIGVGVGLGKVQIDEKLSPGGIYKLPTLPVLNTGDEDGDYEVEVTYLSDQPEFQPPGEWFTFTPQSFSLDAGGSQLVEVSLTLPVDARPGNYFAFLEAHPKAKGEGVTIGIAAATKLNFTVKPAGVLGAAIERLRSLLENNAPFSYIIIAVVGGVLVLSLLVVVGRKYLAVQIRFKGKSAKNKEGG
ncbi:MAG: hypothetical protein HYW63_00755 [Candidatus Levybacteria bacterium]|nr:hypothetical protein [Candidatus Levybacteria bacterium]